MTPIILLDILVALSLQVTTLVLLATVFARLDWRAAWANRIWTLCFLCILSIVASAFLFPHFRVGGLWGVLSAGQASSVAWWQLQIGRFVVTVWGVGMLIHIGLHIWRSIQLAGLLRRECTSLDAQLAAERWGIEAKSLPANLRLLSTRTLGGPFCLQLHQPVIVLPEFLLHEPVTIVRNILSHELAHLRTHHPMQLFLQRLCSFVFWFHPAIWWSASQAELTREFLCDELAATDKNQPLTDYLRTLLRIAERMPPHHCVLSFSRRRGSLGKRAGYLVRYSECRHGRSRRSWLLALAVAGFLVCAVAISQTWVTFNVLASQEPGWSPWPSWSARVLHDFGIHARDFETYDQDRQFYRAFYDE